MSGILTTKPEIKVSVRSLIEFYYRQGDLDLVTYMSNSRMLQGTRAHQKLQKSRPPEYESEISLSYIRESDEFNLLIRGRMDGLYRREDGIILEEIKSITQDPDQIGEQSWLHWWGQAKIYAAIFCEQENLVKIDIQLALYHLDKKKETIIKESFTSLELELFFEQVIGKYLIWAARLSTRQQQRNISLEKLEFPYSSYRKGQRKMAVQVYNAIREQSQLLVQAPTGIGKTMAAIFPAFKAIGTGLVDRIFYLTARTTGKNIAAQTTEILANQGLDCRAIVLTSKDRICFNPEKACHPDDCQYAKGFYDRLEAAIDEAFPIKIYHRATIETICRKHRICPFEFSLDVALWCDLIICDYNYAFDPRVYLRRFFENIDERYTFLVDEAHNLVDRAREMFSRELLKSQTLAVRRTIKGKLPEIYKLISKLNATFLDYKKEMESAEEHSLDKPDALELPARKFIKGTDKWLAINQQTSYRAELLEYYFLVNGFLWGLDNYSSSYRTLYQKERSELAIKLFCLDPADSLAECLTRSKSVIFFSATLTPFNYYQELFGCQPEAKTLNLPSPFPAQNLTISRSRIQTRYRSRTHTMGQLAQSITDFLARQKGNALVFFPSYRYLQDALEIIQQNEHKHQLLIQRSGMTEPERDEFLAEFQKADTLTAGFAVMGGVFGEGIDLVGDYLTAAVIVGVGLPGIDLQRDLIRNYYEDKAKGYDYAYTFPGFTRVLQAAGRVIRTENDIGSVLLIDDRFFTMRYRQLFPKWWQLTR
ncbi:MAG: ATP-dependent DNA helicase [Candidatus Stygibacter frigidus]|nr:ATP-dependent DNA helicase [Candidatus Stygibacter frigidus]